MTDEAQSPVFDPGMTLIYQMPTASTPVLEAGLNYKITSMETLPKNGLWLHVPLAMRCRLQHAGRISSPTTSGSLFAQWKHLTQPESTYTRIAVSK